MNGSRQADKPLVLVTGAAGAIGTALCRVLARDYTIVGLDRSCKDFDGLCVEADLSSERSVRKAFEAIARRHGIEFAAVVHLAAYFDFTGEDNPLYEKVNVQGTRKLLRELQRFSVGRFIYSGTMLVHEPCEPGERIDEAAPVRPKWAYPISKARTEEVIREERGAIPTLRLHLAGLYDEAHVVPTLAHQITRIYERGLKSHLYAGDARAGQSCIHLEDMLDAFRRAVARRDELPDDAVILVGEPDAIGYDELQDHIGRLIHGADEWKTISVPKPVAKTGAWLEEKAEPVIPDAIDQGEKPFIRPFMIDMAEDHYALDITRARTLLGWEPRHRLLDTLPAIIAALKRDPLAWYKANDVTPPEWLKQAAERVDDPERVRREHDAAFRVQHERFRWSGLAGFALGAWLSASPSVMEHASAMAAASDMLAGAIAAVLALLTLARGLAHLRWPLALVAVWILFAPLVFSTPSAAVYLNGTLVGGVLLALALLTPPIPGISPAAARTGPDIPAGWPRSPSAWPQRLLIMVLAFVAFLVARHLAAFQLGHIDGVWDPFFGNGSEAVVTSTISEAFPVSDAGLGAIVYLLEVLLAAAGGQNRWRTMPWLVAAFSFMIIPMGIVSIGFIIIQPILIGTWCAPCLVTAAATLLMIPFAVGETIATWKFVQRRRRAGRPLLAVVFTGDTDDGERMVVDDAFHSPSALWRGLKHTGVRPTWGLAACIGVGIWLMFTRVTLGTDGPMADADHLIGSLVITFSVIAFAGRARWVRWLIVPLGAALLVTPFLFGVPAPAMAASVIAGTALITACRIPGRSESVSVSGRA